VGLSDSEPVSKTGRIPPAGRRRIVQPRSNVMRLVRAIFVLGVIGLVPALAAELPSRKPGLWEMKMEFEGRNTPSQTMKQCIDASTDQMMQSNAGPSGQSTCSKRDVQRSGDTITIDSVCTVGGKTATSHAEITGSFDSAYTMTATSDSAAMPGSKTKMTMAAKWLGPCTGDQKPGDMIMGNGMKFNVLDMQKQGGQPKAR
jgi:Protein of unknown function (DUF3617)